MFKHILVPTDLTERSSRALEIAVKMAKHEGGRVILMHVIEVIEDTDCDEFSEFYSKLGRRAQKKMDKLIGTHGSEDVSIDKEITYGKRINAILDYALNHAVDLIVLASHKLEVENATQGWGTISYKVGILSHCPVMLVK
jgi:nucleotide-binding universal stress UspA family protein